MYKVVVVLVVFAVINLGQGDYFAGKYDDVDIHSILTNHRLLEAFYNCLMGKRACTPEGSDLKSVLVDALESDCAKCSDKQRQGAKEVIVYLHDHEKPWYDTLVAKYDPDNKYRDHYKAEAEKEGIKV
ncbi:chemosensory protein-related [Holotrichia oblita]|uniref:Chemosensory protein-related n=2 Tax=Holotrichia oblita TaxID=644536 RepID=A0ACB9TPC0_HOLOL|nr:chemosensory protein-related [Holotrichia oblita]KAI4468646.1 chemosensory protein-related [Holotrichia oblita]